MCHHHCKCQCAHAQNRKRRREGETDALRADAVLAGGPITPRTVAGQPRGRAAVESTASGSETQWGLPGRNAAQQSPITRTTGPGRAGSHQSPDLKRLCSVDRAASRFCSFSSTPRTSSRRTCDAERSSGLCESAYESSRPAHRVRVRLEYALELRAVRVSVERLQLLAVTRLTRG